MEGKKEGRRWKLFRVRFSCVPERAPTRNIIMKTLIYILVGLILLPSYINEQHVITCILLV